MKEFFYFFLYFFYISKKETLFKMFFFWETKKEVNFFNEINSFFRFAYYGFIALNPLLTS